MKIEITGIVFKELIAMYVINYNKQIPYSMTSRYTHKPLRSDN